MVTADAIEGIVDAQFRFHYDMQADVLYIRQISSEGVETIGELNDAGDILLREQISDRTVGITVVSWWKRFGEGNFPDSISEIARRIEPLAKRLAA